MAGPGHGPGGRPPRGIKPQVKNPGKLFMRLMRYVFRKYKWHYITVIVLICVGVFANVQGTMFQKSLIDDYIGPMLLESNPNFVPLLSAIMRVAGFYLIGVVSVYAYNRIMIVVTQGVLRDFRDDSVEIHDNWWAWVMDRSPSFRDFSVVDSISIYDYDDGVESARSYMCTFRDEFYGNGGRKY